MRKTLRSLTALTTLCALTPAVHGQGGGVRMYVRMAQVDTVTSSSVKTLRAYDTRDHLALTIVMSNDSSSALSIPWASVEQGVSVRVTSGDTSIPIDFEWAPDVWLGGSRLVVSAGDDVRIDPQRALEGKLTVRRTDHAPFGVGQYEIRVLVRPAFSLARADNGEAWRGVVPEGMNLHLVVQHPRDHVERAAALRLSGFEALGQNRTEEALRAFGLARQHDPADVRAMLAVGDIYLRLGRYRDAIPHFEAALKVHLHPTGIGRRLALAYVGVRDETNARRVLRMDTAESLIPSVIADLRKQIHTR